MHYKKNAANMKAENSARYKKKVLAEREIPDGLASPAPKLPPVPKVARRQQRQAEKETKKKKAKAKPRIVYSIPKGKGKDQKRKPKTQEKRKRAKGPQNKRYVGRENNV